MKIIALYLPQYHQIPENDSWWGKGYTEWTSLKRGRKLIENQYQPRIPKNNNYYNLLDINVMKWQVELAKKYGIYGFCFYHYWFNGKLLLQTPIENYLNHKEIEFPFYLCWANETWTTIWEGDENPRILAKQDYIDKKDMDKHFYYLLRYFRDYRYIKKDNKPVLCIYNPVVIPYHLLSYMLKRWNQLSKNEGFNGILFTYMSAESMHYMDDKYKKLFDYGIEYEPSYVQIQDEDIEKGRKKYRKEHFTDILYKKIPATLKLRNALKNKKKKNIVERTSIKTIKDYDAEWNKILNIKHQNYTKYIPGGFVDWDNTPRRGYNGKVILGANPRKFQEYLEKLILRTKKIYKKDYIVLFAWNEWSEGGYLEPDEKWNESYLQAVHNALTNTGELEI